MKSAITLLATKCAAYHDIKSAESVVRLVLSCRSSSGLELFDGQPRCKAAKLPRCGGVACASTSWSRNGEVEGCAGAHNFAASLHDFDVKVSPIARALASFKLGVCLATFEKSSFEAPKRDRMAPTFDHLREEDLDDEDLDEDELDFSDLREKFEVQLEQGYDTFVVIDGLPEVNEEQKPKLVKFLLKKLNTVGKTKEDLIHMPMGEDGKSMR
jgi:hypothetical protein